MKSYEVTKSTYIRIVVEWLNNPNWFTFMRLVRCGFRGNVCFAYRVYRVFKNTFNGRYREIAEKGFNAW